MLIQKLMYVARPAAQVVLYLLIALSVLSIGVIFERWWFFRRRKVDINELGEDLERALRSGDTNAAFAVLRESRSVEAKILTDALKWKADGAESVEQILAKAVRRNRPPVEVGLLFLGTLGNIVLATMKSGGGGGHGQLPAINGGVEPADLARASSAEASAKATRRPAGVEV